MEQNYVTVTLCRQFVHTLLVPAVSALQTSETLCLRLFKLAPVPTFRRYLKTHYFLYRHSDRLSGFLLALQIRLLLATAWMRLKLYLLAYLLTARVDGTTF